MGCAKGACTSEKIFIFVNIAFAMYSGALLATAARLAWDPSTYAWFRFLCETQYRVSAAYVLAAGVWLAALVYLAAAAVGAAAPRPLPTPSHCLHLYAGGVAALALSEVAYGAWMAASLAAWWRSAPQAELARRGIDLLHDLKPALLAVERYRDVARPLYHMIEEVEREAPNNAFVIIVFGALGVVLQISAFVMSCRLARAAGPRGDVGGGAEKEPALAALAALGAGGGGAAPHDADCDSGDCSRHSPPPGWQKKTNLQMYTILDKIF